MDNKLRDFLENQIYKAYATQGRDIPAANLAEALAVALGRYGARPLDPLPWGMYSGERVVTRSAVHAGDHDAFLPGARYEQDITKYPGMRIVTGLNPDPQPWAGMELVGNQTWAVTDRGRGESSMRGRFDTVWFAPRGGYSQDRKDYP